MHRLKKSVTKEKPQCLGEKCYAHMCYKHTVTGSMKHFLVSTLPLPLPFAFALLCVWLFPSIEKILSQQFFPHSVFTL